MSTQNIGSMFEWTSYKNIGPRRPLAKMRWGTMHRDRNPKWSYKVKALAIGITDMTWHDDTMGEVVFLGSHFLWGIFSNPQFWGFFLRISVSGSHFFWRLFSMKIWFIFQEGVLTEDNFQKLKLAWRFLEVEHGLLCPGEIFQMYQQKRKRWQNFPFHGQSSEWDVYKTPRNIYSNQQTSNSFISERRIRLPWGWSFAKRLGWGGIFSPANRQKRDIFSHFHVNSRLAKWKNRLEKFWGLHI